MQMESKAQQALMEQATLLDNLDSLELLEMLDLLDKLETKAQQVLMEQATLLDNLDSLGLMEMLVQQAIKDQQEILAQTEILVAQVALVVLALQGLHLFQILQHKKQDQLEHSEILS